MIYSLKPKKKGEPDILVSNVTKSKKLLNWKITKSFNTIIKDTFIWQKKFENLKKKIRFFNNYKMLLFWYFDLINCEVVCIM